MSVCVFGKMNRNVYKIIFLKRCYYLLSPGAKGDRLMLNRKIRLFLSYLSIFHIAQRIYACF